MTILIQTTATISQRIQAATSNSTTRLISHRFKFLLIYWQFYRTPINNLFHLPTFGILIFRLILITKNLGCKMENKNQILKNSFGKRLSLKKLRGTHYLMSIRNIIQRNLNFISVATVPALKLKRIKPKRKLCIFESMLTK